MSPTGDLLSLLTRARCLCLGPGYTKRSPTSCGLLPSLRMSDTALPSRDTVGTAAEPNPTTVTPTLCRNARNSHGCVNHLSDLLLLDSSASTWVELEWQAWAPGRRGVGLRRVRVGTVWEPIAMNHHGLASLRAVYRP